MVRGREEESKWQLVCSTASQKVPFCKDGGLKYVARGLRFRGVPRAARGAQLQSGLCWQQAVRCGNPPRSGAVGLAGRRSHLKVLVVMSTRPCSPREAEFMEVESPLTTDQVRMYDNAVQVGGVLGRGRWWKQRSAGQGRRGTVGGPLALEGCAVRCFAVAVRRNRGAACSQVSSAHSGVLIMHGLQA